MYNQVMLSDGPTKTVYWLDTEKNYKVGDLLRLKGEDRLWKVEKICSTLLHKSKINRDWKV